MIELHIFLTAKQGAHAEIERTYRERYVPAIVVQKGFRSTTLLKPYGANTSGGIGANVSPFDYEIDIAFDSEADRAAWATGPEHVDCWPRMEALCDRIEWEGFDVVA